MPGKIFELKVRAFAISTISQDIQLKACRIVQKPSLAAAVKWNFFCEKFPQFKSYPWDKVWTPTLEIPPYNQSNQGLFEINNNI